MLRQAPPASPLTVLDPGGGDGLTFAGACEVLEVGAGELTALREAGLVACLRRKGRQVYPRTALTLTRALLALGRMRRWEAGALAWYADLLFAAQVGRTILLPSLSVNSDNTNEAANPLDPPGSWLETYHVAGVLRDLGPDGVGGSHSDELVASTLRSLVAIAVGPDGHWTDADELAEADLWPVIEWFERRGVPIIGQAGAVARDAPQVFMALILAFTTIAPPVSRELGQLVRTTYNKLKGGVFDPGVGVSSDEQAQIGKESLVAVDKVYAAKATEIHAPPEAWDVQLGVVSAQKRTVAMQMRLPSDLPQQTIDNIIDLIRPFLGPYGARVVHLLYEVANDPPYWRNPLITVETNELLDRLGLTRDRRGVHYSRNRETLRNVLNAAHNLEIVGEYTTWEGGVRVRKALRKSVLSLIGATFEEGENSGITTEELFQRGLPKTMQVRLNFYEGVRRPDGRLGNQYVLMPRLAEPRKLPKASHSATHELLRAYLLFRYRQTRMKSHTLVVTRQTAMEKANITNKNPRQATLTLRKALDKLVANGTLEAFSPHLPAKPHETFEVTLTAAVVHNLPTQDEE